ncbi:hypothetical protein [Acuticoccus kandeliae]|uniref:hypothetical protein n=1 Tax=Acuticoccus kandeliae TaxID=2073160 RepID=UPI0013009DA2|nr:hypothetical protein [Acuticoccus kandeliae]
MMGTVILWAIALALLALLLVRDPSRLPDAWRHTVRRAPITLAVVALAIVASGFIGVLLPTALVAAHIGPQSGVAGIVVASLAGAALPGGPMIAFPIVITLARAGAGEPQLISLLTAWSVIAMHRLIAWEIPLLGVPFAVRRIAVSAVFPVAVGLVAGAIVAFTGPW